MDEIRKMIDEQKQLPNPDWNWINKLEKLITTGTITIEANNNHVCINSDNMNCKKNIN